jgi:hypothetical protein
LGLDADRDDTRIYHILSCQLVADSAWDQEGYVAPPSKSIVDLVSKLSDIGDIESFCPDTLSRAMWATEKELHECEAILDRWHSIDRAGKEAQS